MLTNLGISAIEFRAEDDAELAAHTHAKRIELRTVTPSREARGASTRAGRPGLTHGDRHVTAAQRRLVGQRRCLCALCRAANAGAVACERSPRAPVPGDPPASLRVSTGRATPVLLLPCRAA